MTVRRVVPVIDVSVRDLCRCRYPGHPKGCPNYGKRGSCPPQARLLNKVLALDAKVWVVWNRFALGNHAARMLARHPNWSYRQCVCCLYWQNGARKSLEEKIQAFLKTRRGRPVVVRCPEARGVNVTATMASVGVRLQWPPKQWAYQVALLGTSVLVKG